MLRIPGQQSKLSIRQILDMRVSQGDLPLKDIAFQIGVSPTTLRAWIDGRYSPSIENTQKALRYLGYEKKDQQGWRTITLLDSQDKELKFKAKMIDMEAVQLAIDAGASPAILGHVVAEKECNQHDAGVMVYAWLYEIKRAERNRWAAAIAINDKGVPHVMEFENLPDGKKITLHSPGVSVCSLRPRKPETGK